MRLRSLCEESCSRIQGTTCRKISWQALSQTSYPVSGHLRSCQCTSCHLYLVTPATFRTESCDVHTFAEDNRSEVFVIDEKRPPQVSAHWKAAQLIDTGTARCWVRSVIYDRALTGRYGIRMVNRKIWELFFSVQSQVCTVVMRCLKFYPQGCTTDGLKMTLDVQGMIASFERSGLSWTVSSIKESSKP